MSWILALARASMAGEIVAEGTPADIMNHPGANRSPATISPGANVPLPQKRRKPPRRAGCSSSFGARQQPQGCHVEIPLGLFTCVTGVSGGGKSTLVIDTLYKAVARQAERRSSRWSIRPL